MIRQRHVAFLAGALIAMTGAESLGYCLAVSQAYAISLEPDRDGGRRFVR